MSVCGRFWPVHSLPPPCIYACRCQLTARCFCFKTLFLYGIMMGVPSEKKMWGQRAVRGHDCTLVCTPPQRYALGASNTKPCLPCRCVRHVPYAEVALERCKLDSSGHSIRPPSQSYTGASTSLFHNSGLTRCRRSVAVPVPAAGSRRGHPARPGPRPAAGRRRSVAMRTPCQ